MELGGTAPHEVYMPSSDQFHLDEIVFDDFDDSSLDCLDLPSGGGPV